MPKQIQSPDLYNSTLPSLADYPALVADVRSRGVAQKSRVGDMLEIEDSTVRFLDTSQTPPRRSRTASLIGFLEGCQNLAGKSYDDLMIELFPKMLDFTDFSATYGDRIGHNAQIHKIVDLLRTDPDTRRAVINIWEPELDAHGQGQDRPCTLSIAFRIRPAVEFSIHSNEDLHGETILSEMVPDLAPNRSMLNMSVTQRSNDVIRGSYGDFIQFALMQQTIAAALGIRAGWYTHSAHSFHMYTADNDIAEETIHDYRDRFRHNLPPAPIDPIGHLAMPGWSGEQITAEAHAVLSGGSPYTVAGRWIQDEITWRRESLAKARS